MIKTEEGKRFTDEVYATKDEVKAVFNQDNVSSQWQEILSYRHFYDEETDIRDCESNPYKICLTKKLLYVSYSLENRLLNSLLVFNSLNKDLQDSFVLKHKISSLIATSKSNGITVRSDDTFRRLALNEMESIPSSLFALDAYSHTYDNFLLCPAISLKTIETINKELIGIDDESEAKYRINPSKDLINTLLEPPVEALPEQLKSLGSFLESKTIPTILKALTIIYFFDVCRPFEFSNEETAALLSKAFLSSSGFKIIGYLLDFESISYSRSQHFFDKLKESEKSLDLTYYLFFVLPYVLQEEDTIERELNELSAKNKELIQANKTVPATGNDIPVTEEPKENLALPDFPLGTNANKVNDLTSKLLEVHPQLKRKQANFYVSHCTISLHYTIEQFKEAENTVYETARTSMEDLANRGFYKKEKIGNKFVYTPIPLKEKK